MSATIEGWIGLAQDGGRVVPCRDARVCLLLRPLDLEAIKRQAERNGAFNPRLAHMFVEYVLGSPETQARLAYAQVRTDARGRFAFRNIPGDRWYYVTAQALGSVMVSWQVAVYIYPQERVQVVLTNANAALPVYREEVALGEDSPGGMGSRGAGTRWGPGGPGGRPSGSGGGRG